MGGQIDLWFYYIGLLQLGTIATSKKKWPQTDSTKLISLWNKHIYFWSKTQTYMLTEEHTYFMHNADTFHVTLMSSFRFPCKNIRTFSSALGTCFCIMREKYASEQPLPKKAIPLSYQQHNAKKKNPITPTVTQKLNPSPSARIPACHYD